MAEQRFQKDQLVTWDKTESGHLIFSDLVREYGFGPFKVMDVKLRGAMECLIIEPSQGGFIPGDFDGKFFKPAT